MNELETVTYPAAQKSGAFYAKIIFVTLENDKLMVIID